MRDRLSAYAYRYSPPPLAPPHFQRDQDIPGPFWDGACRGLQHRPETFSTGPKVDVSNVALVALLKVIVNRVLAVPQVLPSQLADKKRDGMVPCQ